MCEPATAADDQIAGGRGLAPAGVLVFIAQDGGQRGVVRVHLVIEREHAVRACADGERLARLEIERPLPSALEVDSVLASLIDDPQSQRGSNETAMPGGDIRTVDHDVLIRSRTERVMLDPSLQPPERI
jgi:hypothetical protein